MRTFFDTNVLVYLFDADAPDKKAQARALLEKEAADGTVLLSTQVLQEFYVATTRKLGIPLSSEESERAVRDLSAFPLVQVDASLIIAAIVLGRRYKLSFWDALIIQAAMQGGANVLYTEDLNPGQTIEGVRIDNPFSG